MLEKVRASVLKAENDWQIVNMERQYKSAFKFGKCDTKPTGAPLLKPQNRWL